MDIATLGIKVDSSQATQAATALDKFAAAAKPAAAGAAGFEKAAKGAATGTGLARYEMINLSRQIQDVGVSLVSGQSPFMVLAQQGTQIADIFGSSKTATVGGAIKQVATGIANFLTPMRLLAGGVALAGAAAYVAYGQWKQFALALDDTAKSVGTTTSEMAKLQAAASFKGIDSEEFNKGILQFGRGVYDAKQNMGSLADLFRANNVHASSFDDYLLKAADLIQRAGDDQSRLVILQQMGLPANMQWVRLMSDGASGIRKAKDAAVEFGGAANDNMVAKAREFDEAWNKATTNVSQYLKGITVTGLDWMDKILTVASAIQRMNNGFTAVNKIDRNNPDPNPYSTTNPRFIGPVAPAPVGSAGFIGPVAPGKGGATVDPNAVKNAIAQESAYTAVLDKSRTPAQMLAEMQERLRDAANTKGADRERKQHRLSAAA